MNQLIVQALFETIFMVFASGLIGVVFGTPLAIMLFNSGNNGIHRHKFLYHSLSFVINATRSIPYVILTVLLIPVSRIISGSSIGMYSAVIPLGLSAILLVAKTVEEALKTIPQGLIEMGIAMGATTSQIIWKILIPEALPNIVAGLTLVMINLVGFSAMAGTVGGGGLGDLAIRYGYQRYNLEVLLIIVFILIIFVQILQFLGNTISTIAKKQ